ncbi:Uncharacterized protein OBRU01_14700 [Operophtera brumata]|uniref:Uncharacterized protein n=1 Tax=Operophtera brumata TaxID=104452 RepID=A0A0L7L5U0_OPEBR|nr:Uncharacterized protein OBRU01_14700 [Operophtera brumata]
MADETPSKVLTRRQLKELLASKKLEGAPMKENKKLILHRDTDDPTTSREGLSTPVPCKISPRGTEQHSTSASKTTIFTKISTASSVARRKQLELEAAEAKAKIQMELIDKKLQVDLAKVDQESEKAHHVGTDVPPDEDSQKSVAISNVYSMDFTDSSSDKNNSFGKETYVIEICDSEDSDRYPMHEVKSVISLNSVPKTKKNVHIQCEYNNNVNRAAPTIVHNCSVLAQEIFTQTSKTIFELAQTELVKENLETQTSFITITENKSVEYRIEFNNSTKNIQNNLQINEEINSNFVLTNALEDESSKFHKSDSESIESNDSITEISSDDRIIDIIDEESKDILSEENDEVQYENTSDFEESNDSDIEEDSLMDSRHRIIEIENNSDTSEVPQSVDGDVKELYNKLTESIDIQMDRPYQQDRRFNTLTPLTEESTIKMDSLIDMTPSSKNIAKSTDDSENDVLFTNNAGVKVKMFPKDFDKNSFKLPPIQIQNRSSPNNPHLNLHFSLQASNRLNYSETLPCLHEDHTVRGLDRWEIGTKNLASGESTLISERSDLSQEKDSIHLPPIHIEGYVVNSKISKKDTKYLNVFNINPIEAPEDAICIKEKIKDLKQKNKIRKKARSKAEYSNNRSQVANTLKDIPSLLEKFWGVITEHRIADLVRQVSVHVESPRTQVARSACNTLASDFYEAITLLLTKTSSFSRPVRRAANVALDDIVCGVELSHAVTALCIHGTRDKSLHTQDRSQRHAMPCLSCAEYKALYCFS